MTGYKLINPYIEGNLKTYVNTENANKAAKIIYSSLSKNFSNNIPQYIFSLRDSDDKVYSFKVCEKCKQKGGGKKAKISTSIERIHINNSEKISKFYEKMLKESKEQEGAGKYRFDDSDSDSDSSLSSDSEKDEYYEYYRPIKRKNNFPISKHIMYVPNDYLSYTKGLVYNPVFYHDYWNPMYSMLYYDIIKDELNLS